MFIHSFVWSFWLMDGSPALLFSTQTRETPFLRFLREFGIRDWHQQNRKLLDADDKIVFLAICSCSIICSIVSSVDVKS